MVNLFGEDEGGGGGDRERHFCPPQHFKECVNYLVISHAISLSKG